MPEMSAPRTLAPTHSSGPTPLVSIGLPVYNGEAMVGRAIESLLSQTLTDFELIISDNASSDSTELICRDYAARDSRIAYVRQPQNMGAARNFSFVLHAATGEYFMWAAADDFWYPEFVKENHRVLSETPNVVGCISRVILPHLAHQRERLTGTFPISGSYQQRLRGYLSCPATNSRFYGLVRRDQLLCAYVDEPFLAQDWAIVVGLLRHGEFREVDRVLMERSSHGQSMTSLLTQMKATGGRWPSMALPLSDFNRWLWRHIGALRFVSCLDLIARLNAQFTFIVARELLFRGRRNTLSLSRRVSRRANKSNASGGDAS